MFFANGTRKPVQILRPSSRCKVLEQAASNTQKWGRKRTSTAPSSARECRFGGKIPHFLRKVAPKMGYPCLQRTGDASGLHSSRREFSSRGCAAFRRPPTPTKACRRIRRRQRAGPGALRAFCDAASRGEGTVFGQFFGQVLGRFETGVSRSWWLVLGLQHSKHRFG